VTERGAIELAGPRIRTFGALQMVQACARRVRQIDP
jgi:hypothetical protein